MTEIEQLQARIKELESERDILRTFVHSAFECAFDGCDMEGTHIQYLGLKLGLLRIEKYSDRLAADYSIEEDFNDGDEVYIENHRVNTIKAINEIKAQGIEEAINKAPLTYQADYTPSDMIRTINKTLRAYSKKLRTNHD